jgi:hypothetical protein
VNKDNISSEYTSNSKQSEKDIYYYSNNLTTEHEEKDDDLNYYASLDCSDEIKQILIKLSLEVKEYENALDLYQNKYAKKKMNKKESINKLEKENSDNTKVISTYKDILSNIIDNKGIDGLVIK